MSKVGFQIVTAPGIGEEPSHARMCSFIPFETLIRLRRLSAESPQCLVLRIRDHRDLPAIWGFGTVQPIVVEVVPDFRFGRT